ncbi:hypothetical protein AB6A40_011473 [Gnathostoma spinigerum]|uniref:Uncharacterized protein n=1 Tax=Gnathostoma spinigerum TaxID=75299 RepID=A0ABD6EXR1_9BILA
MKQQVTAVVLLIALVLTVTCSAVDTPYNSGAAGPRDKRWFGYGYPFAYPFYGPGPYYGYGPFFGSPYGWW